MTSIEINGKNVMDTTVPAIVDTGTTLLILPVNVSKSIHSLIPKARYDFMYGWRIPCDFSKSNSTESINIKFGNASFPLLLRDLVRENTTIPGTDASLCYSGVAETNIPFAIIGNTFLRSYYSVYNYANATVGFAKIKSR
jgi:hypothetical protein